MSVTGGVVATRNSFDYSGGAANTNRNPGCTRYPRGFYHLFRVFRALETVSNPEEKRFC